MRITAGLHSSVQQEDPWCRLSVVSQHPGERREVQMDLPVSAYRRQANLWTQSFLIPVLSNTSPFKSTMSGSRRCCCVGQVLRTLHASPVPDAEWRACSKAGTLFPNHRQALKFDADGNHLAAIGEKLEPGHDNEHLCKPTAVAPFLLSSPSLQPPLPRYENAPSGYSHHQVLPSWYRARSASRTRLNTAVDVPSARV